jgi:hypothetical protein
MATNAGGENTALFILMGFKVLGKVENLDVTKPPSDIRKIVDQSIQKRFVKKPGQRIFIDYRLDISPDSIEIFPKNLFTALSFFGYDVPFALNTPFKAWKSFIISYGPSCTGFFLA